MSAGVSSDLPKDVQMQFMRPGQVGPPQRSSPLYTSHSASSSGMAGIFPSATMRSNPMGFS